MDRDQIKKQMRLELEEQLTPEERNSKIIITYEGQDYNAEQVMQEVEKNSALGAYMLEEYLHFQQTGHLLTDELYAEEGEGDTMDQETRDRVITLMQNDLDASTKLAPNWADTPSITDDEGKLLTPREAFQQVKDGTKFGKEFAEDFLINYTMQAELCKVLGIPLPTFDKEVVPNRQSN